MNAFIRTVSYFSAITAMVISTVDPARAAYGMSIAIWLWLISEQERAA